MMLLMSSGVYAQETKTFTDTAKWMHASLSGKTGEVTRAEALKSPEVVVADSKLKVTSFMLTITGAGQKYTKFEGLGSKLTDNMMDAIKSAVPHARLIFEWIKYTDATGKSMGAKPFTIELK